MNKTILKIYALLLTISIEFTFFNAEASFVSVPCTGFTADVVANGIGSPVASTDSTFDAAGWYLLDSTYRYTAGGAVPNRALSPSGFIQSVATAGLNFQLESFNGPNSLRIDVTNSPKTLNFLTPVSASQVYLLGATGSGQGLINITVNFSDGTMQVVGSQSLPDWFGGTGFSIQGIGRVNGLNSQPTGIGAETDPRLYQKLVTLNTWNYTKLISGITISRVSTVGVINIMAVSIATPPLGIQNSKEINTTSIKLFPNPVVSDFYIDLNEIKNVPTETVACRIYNLIGETIYATILPITEEHKIKIHPKQQLAPGIYVMEVEINKKIYFQKFTVN